MVVHNSLRTLGKRLKNKCIKINHNYNDLLFIHNIKNIQIITSINYKIRKGK